MSSTDERPSPFVFRFLVRLGDPKTNVYVETKTVRIKADSSPQAITKLYDKYGDRMVSWDFEARPNRKYRRSAA